MCYIISIKINLSRTKKNRANLMTSSINVINNNKMCNTPIKTRMKPTPKTMKTITLIY